MINYRMSGGGDESLVEELLRRIDKLFPIPLSDKTELSDLAKKLISLGGVCIAMDGDSAVGMVGFYANDHVSRAAYISVVGVVESHQGRGIAKRMVELSLEECSKSGMKTCFLYTHKTNSGAIGMYQRMGFVAREDDTRPDDIKFVIEI